MKVVRKKCDLQAWLSCSALACLLCATSLASVSLGLFNFVNTLGSRASREVAERGSRDFSEKVRGISAEAGQAGDSINDSMDLMRAELETIKLQLLELSTAVHMPDSKDNQTILDDVSDQNGSIVTGVEVPSNPPTVWDIPIHTNCVTRKRFCTVSRLSLLGSNTSSVKFNQCSTVMTTFSEPDMHVTEVLCYVAEPRGNYTTSSLRFQDGQWSCECYGLAVGHTQFRDFECTIAATLCPKYVHANQTTSTE